MFIKATPAIQSEDRVQNQSSENILQTLNKIAKNPIVQGNFVTKALIAGSNVIPHGLGHVAQGWALTDINGIATIYRSAPFNASNLTLTSSAAVTVSLYVF